MEHDQGDFTSDEVADSEEHVVELYDAVAMSVLKRVSTIATRDPQRDAFADEFLGWLYETYKNSAQGREDSYDATVSARVYERFAGWLFGRPLLIHAIFSLERLLYYSEQVKLHFGDNMDIFMWYLCRRVSECFLDGARLIIVQYPMPFISGEEKRSDMYLAVGW